MNLFSPLTPETTSALEKFPGIIDRVFPLPSRFRHKLKNDVANLSGLFTSNRTERGTAYLGKPNLLSAYLRYFLPWNIYRLCRLLPSLPLDLKDGDTITDLGSGPLTLAIALWISRPELRGLKMEFRCVDRTPAVLEAGKKLFAALSAEVVTETAGKTAAENLWVIKTIRGEIKNNGSLSVKILGKAPALVSVLNVYNEIFWNFSPMDKNAARSLANNSGRLLNSLCAGGGQVLVAEPGIPRSGEFIAMLRSAFLENGLEPILPCPHRGECPFPGSGPASKGKAKWCHFAFDTEGAPKELLRLSEAAGIPKDRGVLSFIMAGKRASAPGQNSGGKTQYTQNQSKTETVRIISDSFPVGSQSACYGCSSSGAILALGQRARIAALPSGSAAEVKITGKRDGKSGALIGESPVPTGANTH